MDEYFSPEHLAFLAAAEAAKAGVQAAGVIKADPDAEVVMDEFIISDEHAAILAAEAAKAGVQAAGVIKADPEG